MSGVVPSLLFSDGTGMNHRIRFELLDSSNEFKSLDSSQTKKIYEVTLLGLFIYSENNSIIVVIQIADKVNLFKKVFIKKHIITHLP